MRRNNTHKSLLQVVILAAVLIFQSNSGVASVADRYLVKDGKAASTIVIGDAQPKSAAAAAEELQYHIKQATGVELRVVAQPDMHEVPTEHTIVVIGGGRLAGRLGVDASTLKEESYRVKTHGRYLVFVGQDAQATLWAVGHFLDHQMGVRWLWPGELGTFVPRTDTIAVPDLDVVHRPAMEQRRLRVSLKRSHEYSAFCAIDVTLRC